jgi:hypothetical protein
MPRVGFEPTIPVLERSKTVHALERAATAIGIYSELHCQNNQGWILVQRSITIFKHLISLIFWMVNLSYKSFAVCVCVLNGARKHVKKESEFLGVGSDESARIRSSTAW